MRYCNICDSIENVEHVYTLNLNLLSDIKLKNNILIYYCDKCNFYYSDSDNNQHDYNDYYLNFNNYIEYIPINNKDELCFNFLIEQFKNKIHTILDFGCGNKILANKLSLHYLVDIYDIGMKQIQKKKYDLIILSHVLEHIFDINNFIESLNNMLNENSFLYIEIPNAEKYDLLNEICPLQEINIEHINFFTKYSLNKLMMKYDYYSQILIDDNFYINEKKYYVIRGIFQKNKKNISFKNYIETGNKIIKSIKYENINNLYLYGCGQFLFKLFKNIINCNIINIVDDNKCYIGKNINNINIINYEILKSKIKENDTVIITSIIATNIIKNKLEKINKKINIIEVEYNYL